MNIKIHDAPILCFTWDDTIKLKTYFRGGPFKQELVG